MKFNFSWHVPQQVILVKAPTEFDIEELREASHHVASMVQEGQFPMFVVLDMLGTQKHPNNPKAIIEATVWLKEPNHAWTLHVTSDRFARMLGGITTQALNARYRAFSSVEEAFTFVDYLADGSEFNE